MPPRPNLAWKFAKRLMGLLRIKPLRRFVSREYTDFLCGSVPPRPHGYSLWGPAMDITDYVSWPSLSDHGFSARHLAPTPDDQPIPDRPEPAPAPPKWDPYTSLWKRTDQMVPSARSSVLFAFFAQWFTDSILRIDKEDRRRNTSTHNIDLCQIYGLDEATTRLLRCRREDQVGQLAHRVVQKQQYPDLLHDELGEIKACYRDLPYIGRLRDLNEGFPAERLRSFYATGLERGNSSIGYVAISTVFLREHNRLAQGLHQRYPHWDDERVFQTARNINIAMLLKLLLEEYINHILGEDLFLLEPGFAERRPWFRSNWIALEFDLLYRWHGMVPSKINVPGRAEVSHQEYRNNNELFESLGLVRVLGALSRQPAGRIGLGNTADFLLPAEYESMRMSRRFRLAGFNDYCKHFGLRPLASFDELSLDKALNERISKLYGGDIQKLELLVGLFGQEADEGVLFGPLMARMVAYDALTQIYSNPLLLARIHNVETFSEWGYEELRRTTLQTLVERNVPGAFAAFSTVDKDLVPCEK
jgi:prostaglandin-endoperoxide synthase 2